MTTPLFSPARCAVGVFLLSAALQASAYDDRDFLKHAAQSGQAEVVASKLAETRSASPEVKAFAQAMVADHTKVNEELKALAAKKQVDLPDDPSFPQQTKLKTLSTGDAAKFDERYAKQFGIAAHKDTLRLFEKAAAKAEDPEVKAWAAKTLPALKHHLEMAQALPVNQKKK